MDGCVLALDCFGVPICCPYKKDVRRQKNYCFHKGGFAIIVFTGCDADGRFICATAWNSGNTNGIKVWEDSDLYQYLEIDKGIPEKYFFIDDEAFTNTSQFLSPWPGCGFDHYRDSFNYCLSHSRQSMFVCGALIWHVDTALGYFLATLCFFIASMVLCYPCMHEAA